MKIYVFAGAKEEPNWYFSECRLSKPMLKIDKENKRLHCFFFADHVDHIGAFHILSFKQLLVLPLKHRLYFSRNKAQKRQSENWKRREENAAD